MPDFLLDTCVVIDHLRGEPRVVELLSGLSEQGSLGCSVLTLSEVYSGMRPHESNQTRLFFEAVVLYDVDPACAALGGDYRRKWHGSHGTGLIDGLIAATARLNSLVLVTSGFSHFPMPDVDIIRSA